MCGIVVCAGDLKKQVPECAMDGLRSLEYRGYDSYGFATWTREGGMTLSRSLQSLSEQPETLPEAEVVVGHTRWATHGAVSLENCHPHLAEDGSFALVHNGIVENPLDLADLDQDLSSRSDTSSIIRFLERNLSSKPRVQVLLDLYALMHGRNAIVVLFQDGEVLAIRRGAPLLLGRGMDMQFLASDLQGFVPWAEEYAVMPEECVVSLAKKITVVGSGLVKQELEWQQVESAQAQIPDKEGYRHFMAKEIAEQWQTLSLQAGLVPQLRPLVQHLKSDVRVLVTGAGGAFYTGRQIAYCLRAVGVQAFEVPACEISRVLAVYQPGDLLIAVSQSGETADTLDAALLAKSLGLKVSALVNSDNSALSRLAHWCVPMGVGPETCVLSTKTATAQILDGLILGRLQAGKPVTDLCDLISRAVVTFLSDRTHDRYRAAAQAIRDSQSLFVLGSGRQYGTAQLAALNIKEASYVHAEAFAAGELKHGVIALIEPGTPVLIYLDAQEQAEFRVADNAVHEVIARGAQVLAVSRQPHPQAAFHLPVPQLPADESVVGNVLAGQLLAYYLAIEKGLDPDRPRNLAKSVTVN